MIALLEAARAKIMLRSRVGHAHSAFLVVFSAENVLLMVSTWRIFVLSTFVQFVGNSRRGVTRGKILSLVPLIIVLLRSLFLHSMAKDFVGYLLVFLCGEAW